MYNVQLSNEIKFFFITYLFVLLKEQGIVVKRETHLRMHANPNMSLILSASVCLNYMSVT